MKDRYALVTGAGSGIGRATARVLAEAGATVALLGRTRENLEETRTLLAGDGSHRVLVADVSREAEMAAAYQELTREWGRLDAVVANAGINGVWAPLEELAAEEWDRTLAINLRGTFLTVKGALALLKKQGGAVVIIASINGTRTFSNTGATAYSCSKAAQVAFAKMTALELARDKIRVNAICPGIIKTNIGESTEHRDLKGLRLPVILPEGGVPLTGGKPGCPEDIARVVHFLLSDASSHVSGSEIYVDGAQSLLKG